MIAVDTNILVHAHRADLPSHHAAAAAIRKLAEGKAPWAIPWPCVHEFLATVTRGSVFDPPSPMALALKQVQSWTDSPSLSLLGEGREHLLTLNSLLGESKVTGAKVHDARIAAICLSHGVVELLTADRDFSRFPKLRTRNPMI